ncbi:MAG: hypothetical protein C4320_03065 [Armatimonadota bacterium]
MHRASADLDFDRPSARPDDLRMKGLIAVRLWLRNVVVKEGRDRGESFVDNAEGNVALADALDRNADGEKVVHLLKGDVLPHDFVEDGVKVLRAASDFRIGHAAPLEGLFNLEDDGLEFGFALAAGARDLLADATELVGVEVLEGEVLESPLHIVDP